MGLNLYFGGQLLIVHGHEGFGAGGTFHPHQA